MTLILDLELDVLTTYLPTNEGIQKLEAKELGRTDALSYCCDLDLHRMTLIYEPNLNMLKMYLHAKNEVSMLRLSGVRARTDRPKHRRTRPNTLPCPTQRW